MSTNNSFTESLRSYSSATPHQIEQRHLVARQLMAGGLSLRAPARASPGPVGRRSPPITLREDADAEERRRRRLALLDAEFRRQTEDTPVVAGTRSGAGTPLSAQRSPLRRSSGSTGVADSEARPAATKSMAPIAIASQPIDRKGEAARAAALGPRKSSADGRSASGGSSSRPVSPRVSSRLADSYLAQAEQSRIAAVQRAAFEQRRSPRPTAEHQRTRSPHTFDSRRTSPTARAVGVRTAPINAAYQQQHPQTSAATRSTRTPSSDRRASASVSDPPLRGAPSAPARSAEAGGQAAVGFGSQRRPSSGRSSRTTSPRPGVVGGVGSHTSHTTPMTYPGQQAPVLVAGKRAVRGSGSGTGATSASHFLPATPLVYDTSRSADSFSAGATARHRSSEPTAASLRPAAKAPPPVEPQLARGPAPLIVDAAAIDAAEQRLLAAMRATAGGAAPLAATFGRPAQGSFESALLQHAMGQLMVQRATPYDKGARVQPPLQDAAAALGWQSAETLTAFASRLRAVADELEQMAASERRQASEARLARDPEATLLRRDPFVVAASGGSSAPMVGLGRATQPTNVGASTSDGAERSLTTPMPPLEPSVRRLPHSPFVAGASDVPAHSMARVEESATRGSAQYAPSPSPESAKQAAAIDVFAPSPVGGYYGASPLHRTAPRAAAIRSEHAPAGHTLTAVAARPTLVDIVTPGRAAVAAASAALQELDALDRKIHLREQQDYETSHSAHPSRPLNEDTRRRVQGLVARCGSPEPPRPEAPPSHEAARAHDNLSTFQPPQHQPSPRRLSMPRAVDGPAPLSLLGLRREIAEIDAQRVALQRDAELLRERRAASPHDGSVDPSKVDTLLLLLAEEEDACRARLQLLHQAVAAMAAQESEH